MLKSTLVLIAMVMGVQAAQANEAGVIVGSETGLSAKFELAENNRAIDLAVAYRFNSNTSLSVHADYLIENARHFTLRDASNLNMYYGLGARIENINSGTNKGKTAVGVRAPLGVDYKITNPDVTFFGEVAVVLDVVPDSSVEFAAGIGARIRF